MSGGITVKHGPSKFTKNKKNDKMAGSKKDAKQKRVTNSLEIQARRIASYDSW